MDEKSKNAAKILEAIYQEMDLFRRLSGPVAEAALYLGTDQHKAMCDLAPGSYEPITETFNSYPVILVAKTDYLRMA